jgi:N-carbamoyl-L-amino-acid hydrolase
MADRRRLEQDLMELGAIGWRDGHGMDRPAYSSNYDSARDFVQRRMKEAGLSTRVDSVGNLFGLYPGKGSNSKTILMGSHLDAVSGGGKYDGVVGVIGALEAVRSLKESGITLDKDLEVVAFTSEEGSDLGGTFGSRCFTGLTPKVAPSTLKQYGLTQEMVTGAQADMSKYCSYLELHIEQGPVLWERQIKIGIPTAIVGITRYRVTCIGQTNHAGTTPMALREDALKTAVELLHRWYASTEDITDFVYNVGWLNVQPGSVAVVPGQVDFLLEVRSTDNAVTDQAVAMFCNLLEDYNNCTMELIVQKPAVKLTTSLVNIIKQVCQEKGIGHLLMPSGASHDASPISHFLPTAMVFVPSVHGISHSQDEFTSIDDIACGVDVLEQTLVRLG